MKKSLFLLLLLAGFSAYALNNNSRKDASTKRTNKALQNNVKFQEKAQNRTLLVAVLSVLFLVASVYESHTDQTDENLAILIKQQQEQKKTFNSINSNLEKLYKAVESINTDSIREHVSKSKRH